MVACGKDVACKRPKSGVGLSECEFELLPQRYPCWLNSKSSTELEISIMQNTLGARI